MDMSMSMSASATSSMSGMSMPSSSGSAGMGPSSSASTMMGMSEMAMVFFTSATTPLFSYAWTPAGEGEYTGTCIFLIVFAAIFRALLAFRARFYDILALMQRQQHGILSLQAENGRQRWRASEAVTIAAVDMLLAGIGYLLMIAVMTMNVGYFMSVLAGVFLGSMLFARFGTQLAIC